MAHCRRFLFLKHKVDKTQRKQQKKTKGKEGAHLQAPALPSHFWFMLLPFRFYPSVSSAFF